MAYEAAVRFICMRTYICIKNSSEVSCSRDKKAALNLHCQLIYKVFLFYW